MSYEGLCAYKCVIEYDGGTMSEIIIALTEEAAEIMARSTFNKSPMKDKEIHDFRITEARILHG